MHVTVLVRLKSCLIEFLKVELTHQDNTIGSWFTPAGTGLTWTWTGLNSLHVIDSPCGGVWPGTQTAYICRRKPVRKQKSTQVFLCLSCTLSARCILLTCPPHAVVMYCVTAGLIVFSLVTQETKYCDVCGDFPQTRSWLNTRRRRGGLNAAEERVF